ncbi:immunity 49 family protein [Streptomyces sp. GXMU-J15]|uniref:Immunity 49 family protein n=1 Tax=Streptomyces fuscus TaxID=3048495 RepID=A0ABT7J0F2_9ACTN|nr:immunity 49 family protein [Streptomyces fuscus]MDL2078338.1 immunity 49 family protein [Streptomyces fuscus]
MPTQLLRHEIPTASSPEALEILHGSLTRSIDRLENSPSGFNRTFDSSLTFARSLCATDATVSRLQTWEAFISAMQVGSALFNAAVISEGTVDCRIADKVRVIPAVGPQYYANAGNWIKAFWLAAVCRESSRMDQLSRFPISLLRASGAGYDEYIYHWVDSLQTYWQEDPRLVDKLIVTIDTSYPDVAGNTDRELLEKILYQPINLFHRFLRKDHDGFNEALVEALEHHRQYWTANAQRADSAEGAVALGPLAIACLAYDSGFPIDVESDYLPRALLHRFWVGEFET